MLKPKSYSVAELVERWDCVESTVWQYIQFGELSADFVYPDLSTFPLPKDFAMDFSVCDGDYIIKDWGPRKGEKFFKRWVQVSADDVRRFEAKHNIVPRENEPAWRSEPKRDGAARFSESNGARSAFSLNIEGREALPVRAIPFVTGWGSMEGIAPDGVARQFARLMGKPFDRFLDMAAYHLQTGRPAKVLQQEWAAVVARMEALAAQIHRTRKNEDEGYSRWQNEAALELPEGVFVWWDEFEADWQRYLARASSGLIDGHEDYGKLCPFPMNASKVYLMVMSGFPPIVLGGFERTRLPDGAPDRTFTARLREQLSIAEYWTERQLEALCFGIPPAAYCDRNEIVPEAERMAVRDAISHAIEQGYLRAERLVEPGSPAEMAAVLYGGMWRIDRVRAIRWGAHSYPQTFPTWVLSMNSKAIDELQRSEREAEGRYTIAEAARILAENEGEDFKTIRTFIVQAVYEMKLPAYKAGSKLPIQYAPKAGWHAARAHHDYVSRAGQVSQVHPESDELFGRELNSWLDESGLKILFRFSEPKAPRQAVQRIQPKAQQQENAILEWLKSQPYDLQNLPVPSRKCPGAKSKARDALVGANRPFGSLGSFNKTWERIRADKRIGGGQ